MIKANSMNLFSRSDRTSMHDGIRLDKNMLVQSYLDGVTQKFETEIDGERYIIKIPKTADTNTYSEIVASRCINLFSKDLDVCAHDTYLGFIDNTPVAILKNFIIHGSILKSFANVGQTSVDTELNDKQYEYSEILHIIECHKKMSCIDIKKSIYQFWVMFILDAILANRDRHGGNWGFLYNTHVRPAPIYDNGGSLFPDIARHFETLQHDFYDVVVDRSGYFPASVIKVAGHRSNYYEIINSHLFADLDEVLFKFNHMVTLKTLTSRLKPMLGTLAGMINQTYLKFYFYVVVIRFLHIVQGMPMSDAVVIADKEWSDC